MQTILGMNFGCDFFLGGGLQPWINKAEKLPGLIRWQNSLRNLRANFLKIARSKKEVQPTSALQNLRVNESPARKSDMERLLA